MHAALIVDRIGAVAKDLKIRVAAGRCVPTITVLVTVEADALIRKLLDRHPGLFGDPTYGIAHGAVLTDLRTLRPIRWIDASRTITADGLGGGLGFGGGSRISHQIHESVRMVCVIVDAQRLSRISWSQLADYLTMVSLARPTMNANVNDPDSILSIFTARDGGHRGPNALTDADRRFLTSLYASDPSLDPDLQRAQIADQLRKVRTTSVAGPQHRPLPGPPPPQ